MATQYCPQCGAPWANAHACQRCGFAFPPPPPPSTPYAYPPPPPPPPPPPYHAYPPPPPPPPPPPGYMPPASDEHPDQWARRGSIGTFILALLFAPVVALGFTVIRPGPGLAALLAVTGVVSAVALVEGIRGYRGNSGAQLRTGIAASFYAVELFVITNLSSIDGERLWHDDRLSNKVNTMLLLLALTAAIAAGECFIGRHIARTKR